VICYRGLCFRSYELVHCCGSSECYTNVRVFKHVGNCYYFWAMVSESGPDLVVFLFRILVGFLLYLFLSLAVAQDSHLQRVTIPEAAYVQFASLTF